MFFLSLVLMILIAWNGAIDWLYGHYLRAVMFGWAALFILVAMMTGNL